MILNKKNFIELVKEELSAEDMNKKVELVTIPSYGWIYSINSPVTAVVEDKNCSSICISNKKSDINNISNKQLTFTDIFELLEPLSDDMQIVAEIYGEDYYRGSVQLIGVDLYEGDTFNITDDLVSIQIRCNLNPYNN